ncbi:putative aryl-alcohol dehydrogenase aad14 [Microbotryomycetes sp. JL221]|nr:putative aryl-alcohol dehydrogenase aad14 [Microbotryomycetes sp. JL221]
MSHMFDLSPEPKTALGRHRVLSPTAGIRVSPLTLGAMSIGDAWGGLMGAMSQESSFKLLDAFVEAGGNFIDTSNNYQDEQSETIIGDWMKQRGLRDRIVLATKYTTNYRAHALGKNESINFGGNSRHSLMLSVRDSLKKLQTDYIDILYLHWWDYTTSIEEVMDSLHSLVTQGKVLYLGVSDTPAWIVSAANTYAKAHGKTPFSIYQGRWNVMLRDFERDIIPMTRHFGMALAPWDVLGGGRIKSKKQLEAKRAEGEKLRALLGPEDQSEEEVKFSEVLSAIAEEHGVESPTAICLAYVMSKTPYVFPLVGGRKVEHLHDNIKALTIKLTPEQINRIEEIKQFDLGFPHNFIGTDPSIKGKSDMFLLNAGGWLDFLKGPQPL